MDTLCVLAHFLSEKERKLLERKGFKICRTTRIPSGLYEGDVYEWSLPNELELFPTTNKEKFYICFNGMIVLEVQYLYYNIGGILTFFDIADYWK